MILNELIRSKTERHKYRKTKTRKDSETYRPNTKKKRWTEVEWGKRGKDKNTQRHKDRETENVNMKLN